MRRRWPAAAGALMVVVAVALAQPLPEAWFAPVATRRVVDRHGETVAERRLPSAGHQSWVELEAVAPTVVDALLASEDDRFTLHPGIDPIAVARAAWANLRAGEVVEGGSTLTQQTARLIGGRGRGWSGKLGEAWRAVRIELHLSKREVLTWYLNRASFGAGAVGIEAAAETYFDETAAGLSVAESATLIGLLPAPEARNPWRGTGPAMAARDRVLARMVATGRLTAADAALARDEPLQLRPRAPERVAPHAVERLLRTEGAEVPATLDLRLQRAVEGLVGRHLAELKRHAVDHAAVLVLDGATGDVLAAVGSGDWTAADGQVDGTRAPRSSGSTLKPFLYALALEGDLRPGEVLPDTARSYSTTHGAWWPENYSERFHGPVRARVALGSSLNVPAVVLADRVGVANLHQRLQALGFGHLERRPAEYGLGLAIGGGEVTLEELTAAFATLLRGGAWLPARWRTDVPIPVPMPVFAPEVAALTVDMLADPMARLAGFGRYGSLQRAYPAAVKTGTSTGYRDNWTVGGTAAVTVGVWVGNFDGRPMQDVSGVTGAGPLWAAVLDAATGRRGRSLSTEVGVPETLCALSGLAAGPHCPHSVADRRLAHHPPPASCDWHYPDCSVAWPVEYADWAAQSGVVAARRGCARPGQARIAAPSDGAVFWIDADRPAERQRIPLRAAAPPGTRVAEWTVDGAPVAEVGPPFEWLWTPGTTGAHEIRLRVDGEGAG
ncbi:MAG: penicillin-binding protein 1C, partial [Myxococcota bacterium]